MCLEILLTIFILPIEKFQSSMNIIDQQIIEYH